VSNDRVFLERMQFYGYHGVHAAERILGQRFLVDVEVTADLQAAGEGDDLFQTINYSSLYAHVRDIVEGKPRHLIEAVAEEIAAVLLTHFPIQTVIVTVRKPEVPLRGAILSAAGVSVTRYRNHAAPSAIDTAAPPPADHT